MKYIMVNVDDKEDYDIHDDFVCTTLKALQRQMQNWLMLEDVYPRFHIYLGNFHDGLLQVTSHTELHTDYVNRNGIVVPVIR